VPTVRGRQPSPRYRSSSVPSELRLKVGTWNVEYGRGAGRNEARLKLLQEQAADIWVLTETNDMLDLSPEYWSVATSSRFQDEAGARWATIWSRWPVVERMETSDPSRTLAVHIDVSGRAVVVYGTVLPWQHDGGPSGDAPGWTEFARVTPLQGAEWVALRARHPNAVLIVGGDLNQNIGGLHYYGTRAGRALLREQLSDAGLTCLTDADVMTPGLFKHPPIDHLCVGAPVGSRLLSTVLNGWEGTQDGVRLSDHSAVVAEVQFSNWGESEP